MVSIINSNMHLWLSKAYFTGLILIWLLLQNAVAQGPGIAFTSLTSKDGLSSNAINAILKDRYGLMWFGTDDGLNKFDGTNFKVYRQDLNESATLRSNRITTLFEDQSGNLWVGTDGGGLSLYNRKEDNFTNLKYPGVNNSVNKILADTFGKIWIAHYSGLTVIDPSNRKSLTFKPDAHKRGQLTTNAVLTIFRDKKNTMWVGTTDGLFRYNRKARGFIHYKHDPGLPSSLLDNYVKAIVEDPKGALWISTSKGLSMMRPDRAGFENSFNNIKNYQTLATSNVGPLDIDIQGRLWIGTNHGLYILNRQSGAIANFLPDKRNKHSLASRSINCIYIDKAMGIHWLGTYHSGISKYDKNLSLFRLKEANSFDSKGLSDSRVTSFAMKNSGEIYVGTDGGGLNVFDRRTELFKRVLIPGVTHPSGLSIQALEMTTRKDLWIGTFGNGIFRLSSVGTVGKFQKGETVTDLSSNEVFAITEDRRRNVWIATNGGGLNVYNPDTKNFAKYDATLPKDSPFHLPLNNFLRVIEEDHSGNIWIGSHGAGMAMYNTRHEKFTTYNRAGNNLASDIVLSVLSDRNNNLWVGTSGGGLNFLNKKTNKFISYDEKDGLANNVIHKILEGEDFRLWLSTNAGISSFDRNTNTFKNYSYHNGLQHSNFVLGSGLHTPDGVLFFGGLEGFNYFKPSDLKRNSNVPSLLFTDLKVGGKSVKPLENSGFDEHISVAKEITLDYKQNFSLSFVAINYTSPKENLYSYMLEGFDKVWTHPSPGRTASYTNLDPGQYTFRVKARNNDGVWNASAASIKIIVAPPLWRTTYAYFFYVLAIAGLLAYYRYRTVKKLEDRFTLEQERKETERMRELDNLKIKFLTNLSHEFRTPISLIMGPVSDLVSSESDEKKAGQLNMVKRNTRRLLNLVNQLLDFRKMEENELSLNLVEGDVISFIMEVAESFQDMSERKKIKFSISSNVHNLYTRFDHDKIERILFNLFSNAFKFTPEDCTVKLEVEQQKQNADPFTTWLTIKVSDTGIGIPADKMEKIFDRFYQSPIDAAILNQGTGIGLAITKEFVKMQAGSIEIESEPGERTIFVIKLPFIPLQDSENSAVETGSGIYTPVKLETDPDERQNTEALALKSEMSSILLVEDNEDFRQYLKDKLTAHYRIYEASNGREGWQKALSGHPDLIVSDISMPEMDGIEFCLKVKADKRTSHIPVILLTALTAEEEQVKGLQTGASDYMTKPFNFEILHSKIHNLLTLNRSLKNTYTKQIKVATPEIEMESEDARLLSKVLMYIEQNVNDPKFSVQDLSRQVGMSRSSLYNKIVQLTGQSPLEFIRNFKLDKAAALIEKSDMNIAQIGYMVGFATPNYLAKSFRVRFGVSPSEYMHMKRKAREFKN